jgi:sulfoacetaldehyde acetyltransferase
MDVSPETIRVSALGSLKLSDVGPALRTAADAQKEGKTTILEMMVTRELGDPFRRDALAMPVRHLDKYKSTAAR